MNFIKVYRCICLWRDCKQEFVESMTYFGAVVANAGQVARLTVKPDSCASLEARRRYATGGQRIQSNSTATSQKIVLEI